MSLPIQSVVLAKAQRRKDAKVAKGRSLLWLYLILKDHKSVPHFHLSILRRLARSCFSSPCCAWQETHWGSFARAPAVKFIALSEKPARALAVWAAAAASVAPWQATQDSRTPTVTEAPSNPAL